MQTKNLERTRSQLALATYQSPLRKPLVGWMIVIVLLALVAFAVVQVANLFSGIAVSGHLLVLIEALAVFGLISIIPILALRWLDRREPEPWFMYAIALLWGALIATGIAADVNENLQKTISPLAESLFVAPLIEESAKALGLLVLVFLLRGEFDGPRDGFIYGMLIGLGFSWLETSVYLARGVTESGAVPWGVQLASRYGLLGFAGHGLYTGITGMFLGFALIQKSVPRGIFLFIVGLLLATFSHMAWNSLGAILSGVFSAGIAYVTGGMDATQSAKLDPTQIPIWIYWPSNVLAVLVANGISFLIIIVGLRRSGRWERTTMVEQLRDEVGAAVTAEEYANIQGKCEPPRHNKIAREIFTGQCNLAKRKIFLALHQKPLQGDSVVDAWREYLQVLHEEISAQGGAVNREPAM